MYLYIRYTFARSESVIKAYDSLVPYMVQISKSFKSTFNVKLINGFKLKNLTSVTVIV